MRLISWKLLCQLNIAFSNKITYSFSFKCFQLFSKRFEFFLISLLWHKELFLLLSRLWMKIFLVYFTGFWTLFILILLLLSILIKICLWSFLSFRNENCLNRHISHLRCTLNTNWIRCKPIRGLLFKLLKILKLISHLRYLIRQNLKPLLFSFRLLQMNFNHFQFNTFFIEWF